MYRYDVTKGKIAGDSYIDLDSLGAYIPGSALFLKTSDLYIAQAFTS